MTIALTMDAKQAPIREPDVLLREKTVKRLTQQRQHVLRQLVSLG